MTFGSLFAGVGGIDLGLERAGLECKWQVEHDGYALKVLEKHWPGVPRYRDVRYFLGGRRWRAVRSAWSVDCIAGGFPCQDISNAGKRAGIAGSRSGLWSEYARIVRLLRPRFVFVENVPALTIRGLATVVGDLAALGYDSEWACIPAAAVGAPHPRWRLFLVADRGAGDPSVCGDERDPAAAQRQAEQRGEPDGVDEVHPPDSASIRRGAWWPEQQRQQGRRHIEQLRGQADAPDAVRGGLGSVGQVRSRQPHADLGDEDDAPDADGGRFEVPQQVRSRQPHADLGHEDDAPDADGGRRQQKPRSSFGDEGPHEGRQSEGHHKPSSGHEGHARHAASRIWQRSRWLEFAAFCESQGRLFWPNPVADVRRISDGLSDQLDGTPEPLKAGVANRVNRLRCLGNAVLPQLAEWIGRRIMEMAR